MTSNLFFDTDCISAFLWINDTSIVEKLYKGRIIIPKPVYNELSNPAIPHLKNRIDVLINNKSAEIDTAMILKEAVDKKIITLDEGEIMWAEMLNRKRMLPTNSFKGYLNI